MKSPSAIPPPRRNTIIAVDDEDTVLALMVEVLEEMGFDAIGATRADEALALMASNHPVDMLVTDVRMPGMSGVDLARKVREGHPTIPVLFVTGYATELECGTRRLLDDAAMLTKPFTLDTFAQTIRRMICTRQGGVNP